MITSPSLTNLRKTYFPKIAKKLEQFQEIDFESNEQLEVHPDIQSLFPYLSKTSFLSLVNNGQLQQKPLRIGVVLSGGQAAGGHNVICAIYDAIKSIHQESKLYGFLNGPSGIIKGKYKELTEEFLKDFRNQGGFDVIGSGRTKIETDEQFDTAFKNVLQLQLDGLVIIGGDDSNTNAAYLAEYFLAHQLSTTVIGVPKTIDGDLQSKFVEMSFGFDTACKTYSESIGNIAKDAISNKKYYYFVKLMGRSASHITLECALQTQPNLTFIGEEIEKQNKTLFDVVDEIVQLVLDRSVEKKDYGVILIPEGLIEFLHDVRSLIQELNKLLATTEVHFTKIAEISDPQEKRSYITAFLSPEAKRCFEILPLTIALQLLLDRDPHGNVQVSKIETDRLLMQLVEVRLKSLKQEGVYNGKFSAQGIFCGYEGRSAIPSNFDSDYCYNLGLVAALLVARRKTGYMAALTQLAKQASMWSPQPQPILSMLHFEIRDGKKKAVIAKTLVDLDGKPFQLFKKLRDNWKIQDSYLQPGPIQFFGPPDLSDCTTITLQIR